MENKAIARKLRLLSQLMELHDENPFKIKSVANAAFKVDKLPFKLAEKDPTEVEKIDGIGKSLAGKIAELLQTGTIAEMDTLINNTPPGVVEMMGIKGIGPKKVAAIWRNMGIETVGELFYACNENRLIEAKGFGLKTQQDILKVIEFVMASHGKFLYAQVEPEAKMLMDELKSIFANNLIEFAGEYRRKCEIINELVIVVGTRDVEVAAGTLLTLSLLSNIEREGDCINAVTASGLKVKIYVVERRYFYTTLFIKTGDDEHVKAVTELEVEESDQPESELLIYQKSGLTYIQPELREGKTFIEKAAADKLPTLITFADLKGSLHNHSNWSDGVNTLQEMAAYCRDTLKLEYLGISDHSKTAVYAKGLSIERVLQQHEEIEHFNKTQTGFQIFKGIESDILSDGSLDYPEDILKRFDFIVASIHSNMKMDEEKATARLIKAIENPYTTILGHPTGRLLLARGGYPINYKKVIDACAANNVVIEVNSNPLRLDLDWRWHQYALDKGVWLSINPDAHRNEGFNDMHYGVLAARKGGLYKERCLNALSLPEITQFFKTKILTESAINA
ncbi:DNA polymerase/3'-5' exonuclease PolX [Mucilaginibacter auburnensis]|uniref:DNA polymerase (Family 10) n=1 Tax=Mucilaginibacter auburnensis TaxID=1457233 RepID=A0A2H9VUP6_9SPHI|nr:DNA polymerase/3'-5' exonuclease PolX [Mucilaginibacter auburnensis]PJJ84531.1 DNA polymerase (family 10) [Mucilaginibacter auburnensis]